MTEDKTSYLVRISINHGIQEAILLALQFVAPYDDKQIAYVNNTSGSHLLRAVEACPEPWVKSKQRMENFHYQRVINLRDIVQLIKSKDYDIVIIESIDSILNEPLTDAYEEQNRDLHHIMNLNVHLLFLDDWDYLDRYYLRETIGSKTKRQKVV